MQIFERMSNGWRRGIDNKKKDNQKERKRKKNKNLFTLKGMFTINHRPTGHIKFSIPHFSLSPPNFRSSHLVKCFFFYSMFDVEENVFRHVLFVCLFVCLFYNSFVCCWRESVKGSLSDNQIIWIIENNIVVIYILSPRGKNKRYLIDWSHPLTLHISFFFLLFFSFIFLLSLSF